MTQPLKETRSFRWKRPEEGVDKMDPHLIQVFGLDLVTSLTHPARPVAVWEDQLVDDDVVRVDVALGQLLDEPLGLVQREELGDADTDEGGLLLREDAGGAVGGTEPGRASQTGRRGGVTFQPPQALADVERSPQTHRVLKLLTDGADHRQRLLKLGGQLVGVHVSQS